METKTVIVKIEYNAFAAVTTAIVSYKESEINKNMVELGHPFTDHTTCGKTVIRKEDVIRISEASSEEVRQWLDGYKKFHRETLEKKGYDACEEDISAYDTTD